MNTEDQHPDAGMDLMFGPRPVVIRNQGETINWWPGRRPDLALACEQKPEDRPSYRIGHPRVPRKDRASTQMVGVLILILALCIGVPAVVHIVGYLRAFMHSIG